DLSNRTAVITGGARGIGFALARRLLASGARVALWDRDGDVAHQAAHQLGDECTALEVDVGVSAAVEAAATETADALGGPAHILINSAGITGPNCTTWEYSPEDWQQVMQVNLNGSFHCCRAVVPAMRALGYGRI